MSSNNSDHHHPDSGEDTLREHVFDGIQEYDKRLPNWWLMTLYGTIVFSICYWFFYHVTDAGMSPEEKLARAQTRAAVHAAQGGKGGFTNEQLLAMSGDSELVGSGRTAYGINCSACHGAKAEGGMGPSLLDENWSHGGLPTEILHTILEGVPAKGMPSWKSMLGEDRSAEITAFILSLNPEAYASAESDE